MTAPPAPQTPHHSADPRPLLPILGPQRQASHQDVGDESHGCGGRHTDTGQKKDHRDLRAPKRLPETGPPGGRRSPGGGGWDETWNVEVRSVDIKAGGHRRVLLVLHLPVLWGEWGEQAGPGAGCLPPCKPSLGANLSGLLLSLLYPCPSCALGGQCSPGVGRERRAGPAFCPRTWCPQRSNT